MVEAITFVVILGLILILYLLPKEEQETNLLIGPRVNGESQSEGLADKPRPEGDTLVVDMPENSLLRSIINYSVNNFSPFKSILLNYTYIEDDGVVLYSKDMLRPSITLIAQVRTSNLSRNLYPPKTYSTELKPGDHVLEIPLITHWSVDAFSEEQIESVSIVFGSYNNRLCGVTPKGGGAKFIINSFRIV